MKKDEIMYTGPVTGTLQEAKEQNEKGRYKEEFGEEFEPIQTMWAVNPVEEVEYDGTVGYKDN
ncbi:hypothetical protein [Fredinandcohnia sp. 179-A 10B2 NHS]|uniref:hypothetical protein n=1 Tax=Fredinandcohnia sp. 179-A 10B2 NHS TaxID=3235176 RepID=UPI0039A0E76A